MKQLRTGKLAKLAGITMLVVGMPYYFLKWSDRKKQATAKEFDDFLQQLLTAEDLLSQLAVHFETDKEKIKIALLQWVTDNAKQDPILASIVRIECEITRVKHEEYLVKIAFLLEKGAEAPLLITVGRKTEWIYLPSSVRKDFMRSSKQSTQVFILAERQ